MGMKEWWENLPPKQKKYTALAGAAALALGVSWAFSEIGAPQEQQRRQRPQKIEETTLTADYKMKDDTLSALASEMKFLRTENEKLRKEITRNNNKSSEEVDKLRQEFQKELARLQKRNDMLETRIAQVDDATVQINRDVESTRHYTDEEIAKLKEQGVKFTVDQDGREIPVTDYENGTDTRGQNNALSAISMMDAKTPEEFFAAAPTPKEANQESKPVIDMDTERPRWMPRDGR